MKQTITPSSTWRPSTVRSFRCPTLALALRTPLAFQDRSNDRLEQFQRVRQPSLAIVVVTCISTRPIPIARPAHARQTFSANTTHQFPQAHHGIPSVIGKPPPFSLPASNFLIPSSGSRRPDARRQPHPSLVLEKSPYITPYMHVTPRYISRASVHVSPSKIPADFKFCASASRLHAFFL